MKCKLCGKKVDGNPETCPKCGGPTRPPICPNCGKAVLIDGVCPRCNQGGARAKASPPEK